MAKLKTSSIHDMKLAWHVCIQWLASIDRLDDALELMLKQEERSELNPNTDFNPYIIHVRTWFDSFDFFNCSQITGPWDDPRAEELYDEWQPIRKNLQNYLEDTP